MTTLRERYKPAQFFALDFILTWIPLWLAVAGVHYGWFTFNLLFMFVAAISATLAALIMIYTSRDKALIRDYWDRVFNIKRVGKYWWLFIFLFIPVVNVLATFISLLFDQSLSQLQFQQQFLANPILFALVIFLYGPLPEEMGWRGYGIDSLRTRFNLLTASLLLAVIWSIWHIPLFFLEGSYQNQLLNYLPGAIAFFVAIIPAEIITDWLFYKNDRSTLAAIFFHFSINFSGELLQFHPVTKVIQCCLLVAIAVVIVAADREMFLRKEFKIEFK